MPRPKEFDRESVVKKAMDVFWQNGYERTSMTDLTAATGLKPGSLYNEFGSKYELYIEALDYYQAHIGSCLFDPLLEEDASVDAIRRVFDNVIEAQVSDMTMRGCFMQKAMTTQPKEHVEIHQRAYDGRKMGVELFKQALQRAKENGELSQDTSILYMADYLVGMIYALRTTAHVRWNRPLAEGMVQVALSVLK